MLIMSSDIESTKKVNIPCPYITSSATNREINISCVKPKRGSKKKTGHVLEIFNSYPKSKEGVRKEVIDYARRMSSMQSKVRVAEREVHSVEKRYCPGTEKNIKPNKLIRTYKVRRRLP